MLTGIPADSLIEDICKFASPIGISGSTPDAESDESLAWKNFGELNSCAISFEPITAKITSSIISSQIKQQDDAALLCFLKQKGFS